MFIQKYHVTIAEKLSTAKFSDRTFLNTLLSGEVNRPFKHKSNKSFVHFLKIDNENFYLKRNEKQSIRSIARYLLRGQRAYTASVLEYFTLKTIHQFGLKVMEPVAYGEDLLLGIWPIRGYLLVKEVKGYEVKDVFADDKQNLLQNELLKPLGYYLGILHGNGCYHNPRVIDFFYQWDSELEKYDITMIDVDLKGSKPQVLPFDEMTALKAIAKAFYLFLRSGHFISLTGVNRFLAGYNQGLNSCHINLNKGYLRKIISFANIRIKTHNKNLELREYFSPIPDTVELLFTE